MLGRDNIRSPGFDAVELVSAEPVGDRPPFDARIVGQEYYRICDRPTAGCDSPARHAHRRRCRTKDGDNSIVVGRRQGQCIAIYDFVRDGIAAK